MSGFPPTLQPGELNGSGNREMDTTHPLLDNPRVLDIEIDPPVEWNGKTYNVLHLKEPTGRQVERAEGELTANSNFQSLRKYQFALLSLVSGVPRQVIEQMRITQINEGTDFLRPFISGGQETGGN
jgi:hypothetical protein